MKRKDFLRLLGTAALLPSQSFGAILPIDSTLKKITILHTNDTHARIDPFPLDHPTYANLGGFARRSKFVNQVRAENPHTLLLDAGDVFQGTPYFNLFKGKLDYNLMSEIKYDATTLGNHEFDNGVEGLYDSLQSLQLPVVNSNYKIDDNRFEKSIKNYIIKEVNGIRIGIFGLGIDFNTLVLEENHKGFTYREAISVGKGVSSNLKKYLKCDYVVCLSHIGYEYADDPKRPNDLKLAAESEYIDLIIGGHTHTFLEKPTIVKNKFGRDVIVNQVGYAGINVGKIDLFFNEKKSVITYTSEPKLISEHIG